MRYENALLLAVRAHNGQFRWNKEPYVCHPIRVAMNAVRNLVGFEPSRIENIKIAAILHDVVEDTPVTLEDVRAQFGDVVADAVDHLTNREGESYSDFIERCTQNQIAIRVKIGDLEDNSIGLTPDSDRAKKYAAALARLRPLAAGVTS
jgi:guanosine-3',5'-bis(diphosphate) 3'-pyrophosphohydrolase